MNKRQKAMATALIIVMAALGFQAVPRVRAQEVDIVVDDASIPYGGTNTANTSIDLDTITNVNFKWRDPDNDIRREVDKAPNQCGGGYCWANDTISGDPPLNQSGTWRVRGTHYIDSTWKGDAAIGFIVEEQIPVFPLGLLPMTAVVIALAAYTKRDKLIRPRKPPSQ